VEQSYEVSVMAKCSDCGKAFELIWQKEYANEIVCYCPFCGADLESGDAELIPVEDDD
jgi:DNA-directed RNA polymerase subunit RPC12/RpoP